MSDRNEVKGEIVVAQPTNRFASVDKLPLVPQQLHEIQTVFSTVQPDTPERAAQLYDMMLEGGQNAREWVNRTFKIKDLLVHPVTKTNAETGEVVQLPRVVIWTESGERIQFASFGIWQSLMMMMVCKFRPFGPNEQEFVLVSVPIDKGRSMFKIVRHVPQPAGGKKNATPKQ